MLVPQSMGRLARGKIAGAAMLSLPALGFCLLGALLMLDVKEFARGVEYVIAEPAAWLVVAVVILVFYLAVFYSLRFKRAALALAVVTVVVLSWITTFTLHQLAGVRDEDNAMLGCLIAIPFLCWFLQRRIAARLRVLASEN